MAGSCVSSGVTPTPAPGRSSPHSRLWPVSRSSWTTRARRRTPTELDTARPAQPRLAITARTATSIRSSAGCRSRAGTTPSGRSSASRKLDLADEKIELPSFAPWVEGVLIPDSVEDAASITDPTRLANLQIAATFGTAAMVAQTMAKGGMIGLARGAGVGSRSSAEWDALANQLWDFFRTAVGAAREDPAQPTSYDFDLPMMRKAGPSQIRRTVWPWAMHDNSGIWTWLAGDPDPGGF